MISSKEKFVAENQNFEPQFLVEVIFVRLQYFVYIRKNASELAPQKKPGVIFERCGITLVKC